MDCFTSIVTPGFVPDPNYWEQEIGTTKRQPQYTNQTLWPTSIADVEQHNQMANTVQAVIEISPQQHPNWNLQTQNVRLPSSSSSSWPLINRNVNWQNPMISRGVMIEHLVNTQVTPMFQNRGFQSPQIQGSTPNRVAGVIKKKRKRKRTAFTTDQILALEKIYSTQPYIERTERQSIADSLKINERAIKIWFQNRRMKSKRDVLEDSDEQEEDVRGENFIAQNSPPSDFEYIEMQLQRTDQFGYVTLDENVLGTLACILDGILPTNIDLSVDAIPTDATEILQSTNCEKAVAAVQPIESLSAVFKTTESQRIVYEPISPAESSVNDELDWEPPDDKESLVKLFNLHFC